MSRRQVQEQQVHLRQVMQLVVSIWLAACGAPVDRCANVPCSEGRVCVVKSVDKVACEVPDAGAP